MTKSNKFCMMVLCLIVAGCATGANQAAGTGNTIYGKYFLSVDPTQYIELQPDGICHVGARELGPSGGFHGNIKVFSMACAVKGDTDTVILTGGPGAPKGNSIAFKREGNALVPLMKRDGTPGQQKTMEGAKWIKR